MSVENAGHLLKLAAEALRSARAHLLRAAGDVGERDATTPNRRTFDRLAAMANDVHGLIERCSYERTVLDGELVAEQNANAYRSPPTAAMERERARRDGPQ